MTLEQLCEKYDVSKSSVTNNFKRTQASIQKKTGVLIEKIGRGSAATYQEIIPDNRAVTMYEEVKENVLVDRSMLNYESIEFNCFLGIVLTQFMVFRGSFIDFARYMGIAKPLPRDIEVIKNSLLNLKSRGIIDVIVDNSTEEEFFVASLVRKAEVEMKIGIDMVRTCKQLADQYHKRDYVPILKTWLGMQIMAEDQPYTNAQLEAITGLSRYTIKESKDLLEKSNVFKTSKAYSTYRQCIGQNVDMNGFCN